jgi:hypothetical protein
MKSRKAGDFGESVEIEWLVEMIADVGAKTLYSFQVVVKWLLAVLHGAARSVVGAKYGMGRIDKSCGSAGSQLHLAAARHTAQAEKTGR